MTPRLERAFRWAAVMHHGQTRKASDVPYFAHVAAVALILARAGFDEDTIIAGLLHDIVEDTSATLEDVRAAFGETVGAIVGECSETKHDGEGRKRPWIDRKRDHLAALAGSGVATRAVVLADKLHNLTTIELDLDQGVPVWDRFNAPRADVLWYFGAIVGVCTSDDPRVAALADDCRRALDQLASR